MIIENLTRDIHWTEITDHMLKQGLIERLGNCARDNLDLSASYILLEALNNLLDYGYKKETPRIVLTLDNHGLVDYLQVHLSPAEGYKLDRMRSILQEHDQRTQ